MREKADDLSDRRRLIITTSGVRSSSCEDATEDQQKAEHEEREQRLNVKGNSACCGWDNRNGF